MGNPVQDYINILELHCSFKHPAAKQMAEDYLKELMDKAERFAVIRDYMLLAEDRYAENSIRKAWEYRMRQVSLISAQESYRSTREKLTEADFPPGFFEKLSNPTPYEPHVSPEFFENFPDPPKYEKPTPPTRAYQIGEVIIHKQTKARLTIHEIASNGDYICFSARTTRPFFLSEERVNLKYRREKSI